MNENDRLKDWSQRWPEASPYWNAAARGKLLLPRCDGCGKPHWYPRAICPFCHSGEIGTQEASGQGTVYTYSIMRRVPEPFAIAYVALAEGPVMMTNIIEADLDTLSVGQAVKVVFRADGSGVTLPFFTPL